MHSADGVRLFASVALLVACLFAYLGINSYLALFMGAGGFVALNMIGFETENSFIQSLAWFAAGITSILVMYVFIIMIYATNLG